MDNSTKLNVFLKELRGCTHCSTATPKLPVSPNPILQVGDKARIRIIGQAPGRLAHETSQTFNDPSGVRLRDWLGVNEPTFYSPKNFAITPMGFCFPGHNENGGDLPPRKECEQLWHDRLDSHLTDISLTLLIGQYAQKRHLGQRRKRTLTDTVYSWREYGPDVIPLPHPSWRNNAWIKKNPWFSEILEHLKARIEDLVERQG